MGTRELAEAIILQALEDLWDERRREDSVTFLTGRDFPSFRRFLDVDGASLTSMIDRLLHGRASLRRATPVGVPESAGTKGPATGAPV